jgi:hypothetical protein
MGPRFRGEDTEYGVKAAQLTLARTADRIHFSRNARISWSFNGFIR